MIWIHVSNNQNQSRMTVNTYNYYMHETDIFSLSKFIHSKIIKIRKNWGEKCGETNVNKNIIQQHTIPTARYSIYGWVCSLHGHWISAPWNALDWRSQQSEWQIALHICECAAVWLLLLLASIDASLLKQTLAAPPVVDMLVEALITIDCALKHGSCGVSSGSCAWARFLFCGQWHHW